MLLRLVCCRVVWTVWVSVIVEKFRFVFRFLEVYFCVCFSLVAEKSEERRQTINS